MKCLKTALAVFLWLAVSSSLLSAQHWQPLKNQPKFASPGTALLLTDGTVMMQDSDASDWWKLTPDNTGNYVNGTWKQLASMPKGYGPLYYTSAVLADGRVLVEGGEYNLGNQQVETNLGAIYDPMKNTWAKMNPPNGWANIGDASSVIFANGQLMMADIYNTQSSLLDPKTLKWTNLTGSGKKDRNAEEGWTLLPDGTVLTVDALAAPNAEKFLLSSKKWINASNTKVRLEDPGSQEIGPAVLRPDGTVFATGANASGAGHTAVYFPPKVKTQPGKWVKGPDFPGSDDCADAPAALLITGNVLVMASPGIFQTPSHFYEFDGKKLTKVAAPPQASNDSSYYGRMLELPTGQILFTDGSQDVEVYTPKGSYQSAWAPNVSQFPDTVTRGKTYSISGTQFNGLSQGATYGDDAQMASNYPLVRITNDNTGHVFYARTHDHSTMAVATGSKSVSTNFDVPKNMETGSSHLEVVANGIPSTPVVVTVQ
jgi:hypothetical protein